MTSLGFENYGEALKIYLARYREVSNLEHICAKRDTNNIRILLLAVSTNAQASPALKEKQPPPTTALTAPAFLETLWTRLRKVQPTLPATLWRISLSIRHATRGLNIPLWYPKLSGP